MTRVTEALYPFMGFAVVRSGRRMLAQSTAGHCHDNRTHRTQPGLPRGRRGNGCPDPCAAAGRCDDGADRSVAPALEAGPADMPRLGLPDSDLLGAGIC